MAAEVFSYPPSIPKDPEYSEPESENIIELYQSTGFPQSMPGKNTTASAVRGSTATNLSPNGHINFRHEMSDVDFYAVTDENTQEANRASAGYLIYHVIPPGHTTQREVDVLHFTPQRITQEQNNQHRTFLTSKLVQPGWPVVNPELLKQYRTGAMATLITRGCARRDIHTITPSGAVQLVIEEDLYAEPWRWQSLNAAYATSAHAQRQVAQTYELATNALNKLQDDGYASNSTHKFRSPDEEVFDIGTLDNFRKRSPKIDQVLSMFGFVYDQLAILAASRTGFSVENAARVLMKMQSLMANSGFSYSADRVFNQK